MMIKNASPIRPEAFLRLAVMIVVGTTASPTIGQTHSEPAATSVEIIITARRRDEPLARAAVPVSALDGEALLERGAIGTDRLSEILPALTVQPTATGNLLFIRGVGNFTLLPNSDPAVGFTYDGVFIARPMGTMSQFFDLDRIELLKGPQGVLYGRNASAGSINLEPRQPVIGRRSAHAHLSVSSYSHLQAETAVNLPIGTEIALRLSGAVGAQDHFLEGYTSGPHQRSARLQLKALPSSGTIVRLAADYNHLAGVGIGTSYVGNYLFSASEGRYHFIPAPTGLDEGIYSDEGQSYRQTIFVQSAGRNLDAIGSTPRQDDLFYGLHGRLDRDLGFARLTILPAWRKSQIDAIVSGSPFGYRQNEVYDQTSLEARLIGNHGVIEWLAGTFLFHEKIEADTATNLSTSLIISHQNFRTRSFALFGNATLHATDRLRFTGGVRGTRDRKSFDSESGTLSLICQQRVNNRPSCPFVPLFPLATNFGDVPFPVPLEPGGRLPILIANLPTGAVVARTGRVDNARLDDEALTWRLGAEFDLGPRTLVYALAETGYRPGGFNSATGFETYAPERITAYTWGLRHRAFENLLQLDVEAFWWDYRDQQVSSLRPDLSTPPRNANITDNIGRSRIRGIETTLRVRPWNAASFEATIHYLDAAYRSFRYLQTNTGTPPLTGCPAMLDTATNLYLIDCTGQRPFNTPKLSWTLDARQSFALPGATIVAVLSTHYRSARNIGFAFLPEQRIGANWTSNAQLILTAPDDRLGIAAFIRNIEGNRIPQFMIFHPVSNALVASSSPPRQIGLRGWMRF
jgi:iron complex outermembrane recepter protein